MNKRQLVAATARRSSLTQGQVREALESAVEVIAATLRDGDHVLIGGFGRFDVQPYPARSLQRFDGSGHYPVESRPVPVFRSSKRLRQKVRGE